jgi:hypothetical protein
VVVLDIVTKIAQNPIAIAKMSFQKNDRRWIESPGLRPSENAIKFLPLPRGEGRGEGERRHIHPEIYFGNHSSCEDEKDDADGANASPTFNHTESGVSLGIALVYPNNEA